MGPSLFPSAYATQYIPKRIEWRRNMQVVLEVKGEVQLTNLAKKLQDEGVLHKVWVEQPEGYPTALATKPYLKSSIAHHFKKLKLCKATLS
jgi:hypothetical protein